MNKVYLHEGGRFYPSSVHAYERAYLDLRLGDISEGQKLEAGDVDYPQKLVQFVYLVVFSKKAYELEMVEKHFLPREEYKPCLDEDFDQVKDCFDRHIEKYTMRLPAIDLNRLKKLLFFRVTGCAIPFKDKEKAMERKNNKGCKQKGIVERVTKEYEVTRC